MSAPKTLATRVFSNGKLLDFHTFKKTYDERFFYIIAEQDFVLCKEYDCVEQDYENPEDLFNPSKCGILYRVTPLSDEYELFGNKTILYVYVLKIIETR